MAYMMYYDGLVTITGLRKDLFQYAENALQGERVEFTYKGVVFQLVPETRKKSKLDNLIGEPTVAPGIDIEDALREQSEEITAAWDAKWDSL